MGEALGEILPRVHGRIFRNVGPTPVSWRTESVVSCDLGLVIGPLVTENRPALIEIAGHPRPAFHQDALVIMADLMAEMAEHGAVGLAETNPLRLTVGIERLDQVDGDHPTGMPDLHALSVAVAGHQIESKPALTAPKRIDRKAEIDELVNQAPQRGRRGRQLFHGNGVVSV